METCSMCFYPQDVCDCDPDVVDYAAKNQEEYAERERQNQRVREMHDLNARMVLDVMNYKHIQVMNDDNSLNS